PAKQKKFKSKSSRNVVRTKDQIHIILDSGHGGIDPGAVKGDPKKGDRVYEDDVVYDIVQRMLPELKQSGFVVHETVRDKSQSGPVKYLSEKVDRDEELLVNPRSWQCKSRSKHACVFSESSLPKTTQTGCAL
ncbi:MAG: N-acetylmuramoyl-L-alanine amidase, partial [Deltaproteobacteria bacterium]